MRSMSLSLEPRKLWVLLDKEGGVLTGHCDCPAGLSLICSHIGSLLYCAVTLKSESCTSRPQQWNNHAKNHKHLDLPEKLVNVQVSNRAVRQKFVKAREIGPASEEKITEMLNKLKEEKRPCSLLRSEQQTCSEFIPEQMKVHIPLTYLYDESYQLLNITDLIKLSDDYLCKYNLSSEQRLKIELLTKIASYYLP